MMMPEYGDLDLDDLNLDGTPDNPRGTALIDFLADLAQLSMRYRLVLHSHTDDGEVRAIDLSTMTVIGVGLAPMLHSATDRITPGFDVAYDMIGSILDGSWLVENDTKELIEQREVPSWRARHHLLDPYETHTHEEN